MFSNYLLSKKIPLINQVLYYHSPTLKNLYKIARTTGGRKLLDWIGNNKKSIQFQFYDFPN